MRGVCYKRIPCLLSGYIYVRVVGCPHYFCAASVYETIYILQYNMNPQTINKKDKNVQNKIYTIILFNRITGK